MPTRYEAQWITKQFGFEEGDWDPDQDEYGISHHATKAAAEKAAIRGSQNAAQCEWIVVTEQEYIGGDWVDQRRWSGDWQGLHPDVTDLRRAV